MQKINLKEFFFQVKTDKGKLIITLEDTYTPRMSLPVIGETTWIPVLERKDSANMYSKFMCKKLLVFTLYSIAL